MMSITEIVAVKGRLRWKPARIVKVIAETSCMKTLVIEVPDWEGHRPGQHVDVRFSSDDGYWDQRSYSIASSPEKERLMLLVGRQDDSELSPYLGDELREADKLELRSPIGINFTWEPRMGGPLLLVAGGCGIAPLMSIIRHRVAVGDDMQTRLLYSSRSFDDIAYREELNRLSKTDDMFEVIHTLTRLQPAGWTSHGRRIDKEMLNEVAWRPEENPLAFICGPTPMVRTVAMGLVDLGYDPVRIKRPRATYRR